jgi:hypothetical protein
MMASIPEYNAYAQEVLAPQMDPTILKELQEMEKNNDFDNPKYSELKYYTKHILRKFVGRMSIKSFHILMSMLCGHSIWHRNASLKNWM